MYRHIRLTVPFAAIATAAALTVGGAAAAATGGQHSQAAGMAGAGQTSGRSAVPWSKVGPGWALVTYTTATPYAGAHGKPGATTLYLVDPAGGKYVMHRWPQVPADGGVFLVGWSGDKTRAMLEVAKSPTSNAEQLDQLTLATGKLTRLPLPASASPLSYTRPDGTAVLAEHFVKSPPEIQIVRYSLSGKLQKVLFTQKTVKNSGASFTSGPFSPYNPDGTKIALTYFSGSAKSADQSLLVSNAGGVIHRYGSTDSCVVARWWTSTALLTVNCAGRRLFVTPTSGARPIAIAPATTSPELFEQNAVELARHTYVQESGPACGSTFLSVVHNGHLDRLSPTHASGATIVTASTSSLLIVSEDCMGSSGLLWFNPRTKAEVQVLGLNHGQGVIGWVPYYELNP